MKEIKAYIRPERVEAVADALEEAGVPGMTLIHVQAIGEACDPDRVKLSMALARRYMQVVKLEIVCADNEVDGFVELIRDKGHTGQKGDGMVFVCDMSQAVSIRTGRRGVEGLRNLEEG